MSLILLDTQCVIWLNQEQSRLSAAARAAIAESRVAAGGGVAISAISLWEFAMVSSRNRITLEVPLAVALRELERFYTMLPITAEVAELSIMFSSKFPNDPSDRIIAATALTHRIPLVTADSAIRRSGEVPTIW